MGNTLLPDANEAAVREYVGKRLREGCSGRTVNKELGELSRAIGKPWSVLWPNVRKQEERKDVGRCLSGEEETRLLTAATALPSPYHSHDFARGSDNGYARWRSDFVELGSDRHGKASYNRWPGQDSGGNRPDDSNEPGPAEPLRRASRMVQATIGEVRPEHYVYPFGSPRPIDPKRTTTTVKKVWGTVRRMANVSCRFHDLRHTALTKMAERGVSMKALAGHMSQATIERYSHIRMASKREAVEAMNLRSEGGVPKYPQSEPIEGNQLTHKLFIFMELAEGLEPPTL